MLENENEVENKIYYVGTTIFFSNSKGYGFLEWRDKNDIKMKDMFFHWSAIQISGFKTLKQGQRVQFEIGKNLRGQEVAINIVPINT